MDIIAKLLDEGLLLALIAALGGCMIRITVDARAGHKISARAAICDGVISLFLGFYAAWYILDELNMKLINACAVCIIVGYLNSKVLDLAKDIMIQKAKAHLKVPKEL